jgi:hypothetical protein
VQSLFQTSNPAAPRTPGRPFQMADIVRKTWGKMGERGRAAALKLQLSPAEADVVQRALAG